MPFRIDFISDGIEFKDEAAAKNAGFKLRYFQTGC